MDEVEPLEQLARPRLRLGPGGAEHAGDEHEVLLAGQVVVQARVLAGQADALADLPGVRDHVEPEDAGAAAVGAGEGAQGPYRGGLAGAVGAEHAQDGPGGGGEVDAVEGPDVAERLHQPSDLDRVLHGMPFWCRLAE